MAVLTGSQTDLLWVEPRVAPMAALKAFPSAANLAFQWADMLARPWAAHWAEMRAVPTAKLTARMLVARMAAPKVELTDEN